jgi:branched-chain amino acid transport system permease protein
MQALRRWAPTLAWVLFAVALMLVPLVTSRLTTFILGQAVVFGVAAVSLNLLIGFGKMVSFGHAAWWGLGGYTTGIVLQRLTGLGILGALLVGIVVTVLVSAVVGYFCVRRGTIYFSMLTLAFAQLVMLAILRMRGLTGGEQGLTGGVPRPDVGPFDVSGMQEFYWFSVVVSLVALAGMAWFLASPFGLSLRALAADADRAAATGINVKLHQWATFVVAAAFASIAGGLHAVSQSAAFPESLHWTTSALFLFMGLVGGIQHFVGPLVGAAVYIYLERFAGELDARDLVLGGLLLAIVLFLRGGVVGAAVSLWRWGSGQYEKRRGGPRSAAPAGADDNLVRASGGS